MDYSKVFGNKLVEMAEKMKNCCNYCINERWNRVNKISKQFPKRFFDIGIAEQHAITLAAGMATQGANTGCSNIFIILSKSI